MYSYYYHDSIAKFRKTSIEEVLGVMTIASQFDNNLQQISAWKQQIPILVDSLKELEGNIFLEFSIPRMGKRVDAVVIIANVVFIIEFKVGESQYLSNNIDQVWDYALDLKNFHKPSHDVAIVPILLATEAKLSYFLVSTSLHNDKLSYPLRVNKKDLASAAKSALDFFKGEGQIDGHNFAKGAYHPTPTIIESAISLYNNHSVEEITRSDASAKNLTNTTGAISNLIDDAKKNKKKILCLVTGVPGAGKTLVGLKIATSHLDKSKGDSAVYLSGNAPLVAILQEALSRDQVQRDFAKGIKTAKSRAKQAVKSFIQIIHHYRDAYLVNEEAPYDHVAIFDEAQRAWNKEQTVKFMRQKKNKPDFQHSEPEFLISCLDRHKDWALIICLVGGGQEINTGEAGISEWLYAIHNRFTNWEVHMSPNLNDSEYFANDAIQLLSSTSKLNFNSNLHLEVSMRSFRAEKLSLFIKLLLDLELENARKVLVEINPTYKIVLTRDLSKAKKWLKDQARGSERYGIVVSSQAQRLKPYAIDVKSPIDPVHWFLEDKDDVRSSYFLEDVATEFHVQGLELDWACVTWDGDLRYSKIGWNAFSFKGNNWQNINKRERKQYLINAYRVLLTRARQGMVIVVPEGDDNDKTRQKVFFDTTFQYLTEIGLQRI